MVNALTSMSRDCLDIPNESQANKQNGESQIPKKCLFTCHGTHGNSSRECAE